MCAPKKGTELVRTRLLKYKRSLAFVGGVIVFATFVIKDAMRENLKDLADAIDRTQTLFTMMREIIRTRESLEVVRRDTGALVDEMITPARRSFPVYVRHLQASDDIALFSDIKAELALDVELARRVHGENFKFAALEEIQQTVNNAISIAEESTQTDDPGYSDPVAVSQIARAAQADAGDYGNRLLEDASRLKEKTEKRYRLFTRLSYVLYSVGWGLGLVGRFFDFEITEIEQ